MLVGRDAELAVLRARVDAAVHGHGSALCLEGEPGIGKSALLDAVAAAVLGGGADLGVVRLVGVESELLLGHAGLFDLTAPMVDRIGELPGAQRAALESALGRTAEDATADRFLVSAALLSLLSLEAQRRPLLVLVDDVQWVDAESRSALAFAARRVGHDRVALLLARRTGPGVADLPELAGIERLPLTGLGASDAAGLLRGALAPAVVDVLMDRTDGNPLALLESARSLTPEQRRGSAPLPAALPVSARLTGTFVDAVTGLSPPARWAVTLAAASLDAEPAPILRALDAAGIEPTAALAEAERAGVLRLSDHALQFRHPLVRNAVWLEVGPAERRRAHLALADVLTHRPAARLRHRAEGAAGFDDALGQELLGLADQERRSAGYAAASALCERASALLSAPGPSLDALAAAIDDAALSGDVTRVRRLVAQVIDQPVDVSPQAHARALLSAGALEQFAGNVRDAADMLTRAAELGSGLVRIRALFELLQAHYRLASPSGMRSDADEIATHADPEDPEQAMLVAYARASALAFSGDWAAAGPPALQAFELVESTPSLRDDPRYLVTTGLAAGWAGRLDLAFAVADRRVSAARAAGALGVLPMAFSLISGGMMLLGRHQEAYALAGEAVELGTEMGYVADVGIAQELLSWQLAARGRADEAREALDRARALQVRAGVAGVAVHSELVDAFCALCVGDSPRVVEILEHRLTVDEGRQPRGDYPLSVAPDLVEAYLALGRRADAIALADRHAALHGDTADPEIRADRLRMAGMLASDRAAAESAFEAAHAAGAETFAAARIRLAHGEWLRRAGERIAAREQLRTALAMFDDLGFAAWTARVQHELAATGQSARRGADRDSAMTSQETRVALLVARGMTNKEIAAALFLSPKTVEHHVTSALRKRGLRSRVELAAAFATGAGPPPAAGPPDDRGP